MSDEKSERPDEEATGEGNGPAEDERSFVDRHLGIFFRESTLWPVTLVIGLSAGALLASMILLAIEDRNLPAMGALLIVAGMSIDGLQREIRTRGFGTLSGLILGLWGIAGAIAALASFYGVF